MYRSNRHTMDNAISNLMLLLQYAAFCACISIIYTLLFGSKKTSHQSERQSSYCTAEWYFFLKKWWVQWTLWRERLYSCSPEIDVVTAFMPTSEDEELEKPKYLTQPQEVDMMTIKATDRKGNAILVHMSRSFMNKMSLYLQIVLEDGAVYQFPGYGIMYAHSTMVWCGAGIKFELCEPLRKWRLTFNGLLRLGSPYNPKIQDDEEENLQHVQFSFLWTACSNTANLQNNWSSSLIGDALAREHWKDGKWLDMRKHIGDGYSQWGTLYGKIKIRGLKNISKKLYLRGIRQRQWGKDNVLWLRRAVNFVGVTTDGTMFAIKGINCMKPGLTHAIFGQVCQPDGHHYDVDSCNLHLPDIGEHPDDIPRLVTVRFSAGGKNYTAMLHNEPWSALMLHGGQPWNSEIHSFLIRCNLNGKVGTGTAVYWYRYSGPSPNFSYVFSPILKDLQLQPVSDIPLVVTFRDKYCCSSVIVGEKAASLGLMSSVSEDQLSAKVQSGFCITLAALEEQLRCETKLEKAVTALEKLFQCGHNLALIQEHCDRIVHLFQSIPVCEAVRKAVLLELQSLCCSESRFLAVRSSIIGENSEELCTSAQYSNLLGVPKEINHVLDAIKTCWASLFTLHAVYSRRQNGQRVRTSMSVIVQPMVKAECAGVLFTRDPLNGDPRILLITSNFGLGESVVSAEVEPDVIILQKGKERTLKIIQHICGKKSYKVVISDKGGIIKEPLEIIRSSQISLAEKEMLTLGQIGISLEDLFGEPREVEWAIQNGIVYLLQARPIAALSSWSDFELLHEFDAPIITDNDLLTTEIAREMFPRAITPLSHSISLSSAEIAMRQGLSYRANYHYLYNMSATCYHPMVNVLNSITNTRKAKEKPLADRIVDLAIYGHKVTTTKIHHLSAERNGKMGQFQNFFIFFGMMKDIILSKSAAQQARHLASKFRIKTESKSASETYSYISFSLKHLAQVAEHYGHTSKISIFLQILLMELLTKGCSNLTPEHQYEMALLLSVCSGGVSAQIPAALKEFVSAIVTSGKASGFCKINPKQALQWLESNCHVGLAKLQEYLHEQGHRSITEFELMTKTWSMQPKALIKFLQLIIRKTAQCNGASSCMKVPLKEKEVLSQLKLKNGTRIILRWLLKLCKSSIANQEKCRASYVTIIHKLRLAYWSLAEKLVREELIPNQELIFFFTHYELGTLIRSQNRALIFKATRRRELYPQCTKLSFPEINVGLPQPLHGVLRPESSTIHVKGTPVSPGIAMGRTCVVRCLNDIEMLQQGDILITHSTGFGWSPYFPLLQGIVTELGGFATPGSIIAREFGIPCIVAARDATKIFRTGDIVLLGKFGTVDRIVETSGAVLN